MWALRAASAHALGQGSACKVAVAVTLLWLLGLRRGGGGGRQVLWGVDLADHGEGRTHTGQVYDDKDNRKVGFVSRQKEVNENFTIHLIAEQPVSQVSSRVISCEGAGGPLPTPKCT